MGLPGPGTATLDTTSDARGARWRGRLDAGHCRVGQREYGRYGYRRISALLRHQGWHVNHKRVERIWRRERKYLTVWHKQPDGLWKLQADIFNTDGPPTAIED